MEQCNTAHYGFIIGKIPVVLYQQDKPEWDDVQHLIEIAEEQRSNFSESNKKFGEPILMVSGRVEGKMTGNNTGGKVLEVRDGGNAQFVAPPNANENFDKEMTMNLRKDEKFVQDEGWYKANKNYAEFLKKYKAQEDVLIFLCFIIRNIGGCNE